MKLFATLLVAFVARASANSFVPTTRVQLQAAADMYCAGVWPVSSKPDEWDIEFITNLDHLFANSSGCNPNVSNWNVANVDSFIGMFENATGFNHDIGNWEIKANAKTAEIFAGACPANSTAIDSVAISKSANATARAEVVLQLGEIAKRCACDGDLGFNSDSECVVCADIDMIKNEEGLCETNCPAGAEQYGDSCSCTSSNEAYDEEENKCVCKEGSYGDGNGTCEKCPADYTEKKYGVDAGVGDIEDRCECFGYYEVWDSDEEMCVCKKGAYGDGNGECKKCPAGMEAAEDEPGTGDKEDRCKCTNSDWTKWDDDEEKCLCKEGAYMWKDECYECERDMEPNVEAEKLGDGDIHDRCQCTNDEYFIPEDKYKCEYYCGGENTDQVDEEEECGCKRGYYQTSDDSESCEQCPDGTKAKDDTIVQYGTIEVRCGCKRGYYQTSVNIDTCEKCPAGMKGVSSKGVNYGSKEERCECDSDKVEVDGECICPEGYYLYKGYCYECGYDGETKAKVLGVDEIGPGNSEDFEDRCLCKDENLVIDGWKCVEPPPTDP